MQEKHFYRHKPITLVALLALLGVALVSAGLFLFFSPMEKSSPGVASRPNIVLIVMDAFRADKVGATRNGVPLTPFLDSLTEKGACFSNAVTNCTWTRPAMASLYTSLYVDAHQVVYDTHVAEETGAYAALSPELDTIATVFKEAGYATIGIQTNGNLFPEFGFQRGFDVYRTAMDAEGARVTDWALEEAGRTGPPFFLYAHYMDPHLPYDPPRQYREMMGYAPESLSPEEREIVEHFRDYLMAHCKLKTGQLSRFPFTPLSEAGREAVRCLYDACIRYTDDEVRRLVESARANAPRTVFIILADHGEHFWDHDLLGHGITLYDCELRIPLFLFGEGVTPAKITRPVELIDVLPTLASLAGLAPMEAWQGRDVFLDGDRPVYAKTRAVSPAWNTHLESVIAEGKKLILDRREDSLQLYDWLGDPGEHNNLATAETETTERLRNLLEQHYRLNLRARQSTHQETTIDEETREQLRRLGYMD